MTSTDRILEVHFDTVENNIFLQSEISVIGKTKNILNRYQNLYIHKSFDKERTLDFALYLLKNVDSLLKMKDTDSINYNYYKGKIYLVDIKVKKSYNTFFFNEKKNIFLNDFESKIKLCYPELYDNY
jgi:hypothetical protein